MRPAGRMLPTPGLEPQMASLLFQFIEKKCGHLIKNHKALKRHQYFT